MGEQQDVYTRVTNKIIADLEKGELTWRQPWKAGHAAGPITKPLRHNGERYRGINVLMLWAWSLEKGFVAPIWMTFKQVRCSGRARSQGRAWQPCRVCLKHEKDRPGRQRRRKLSEKSRSLRVIRYLTLSRSRACPPTITPGWSRCIHPRLSAWNPPKGFLPRPAR